MTKPMELKRAILFLNLGGPETQADVRPFLQRLFEDPEIIRIPFAPLRKFAAWAISSSREQESKAMYQEIGGGSPIRRLTDQQAAAARTSLEKRGLHADVRTAFTCSAPLVEDVVKELVEKGVEKFLAFPLYPQYSLTTTKGALDRVRRSVRRASPKPHLVEISSWHRHPLFVKAHVELIRKALSAFSDPSDRHIHLIFSAHSIPEKLVTKWGDPYRAQMQETVDDVLGELHWKGPWTLSWQSKLGPIKWLEPSTKDTVRELGKEGVKRILVVPIAFVTDHIETLFELDRQMSETAKEAGIAEFRRVPGLNDHPTFIEALADLAAGQSGFWN